MNCENCLSKQNEIDFWRGKYNDLNKALMAELRDPTGTIWEHAKKLQEEVECMKKSEKAMLETINQQGDEIKELKQALSGRTVSCKECISMARNVSEIESKFRILQRVHDNIVSQDERRIKNLESKIAVAKEALKRAEIEFRDLVPIFRKQGWTDTALACKEEANLCNKALAELEEK